MTLLLEGVWPACPTMLQEDEKLDEESMRRVSRFLVDAGVDGLWLFGGGGEGVLLGDEVRRHAAEVVLDEVEGAVPVVVGISAEGTARALARFRALADLPVAGVFATPPFYYVCTREELYSFYGDLARETARPLIVYNNPFVAKASIAPADASALAEIEGVVGLKDSSGDFLVTQAMIRVASTRPEFAIMQGYDQLAAASLLTGAAGVVSAVACFVPHLMVGIAAAVRSGEANRALALQDELLDLLDRLSWDPYSDSAFIRGVKTCLDVLGVGASSVARPFADATVAEREAVAGALEAATPARSA
jgi:4-hydroxy-tetrahydrodipicolinate synthase